MFGLGRHLTGRQRPYRTTTVFTTDRPLDTRPPPLCRVVALDAVRARFACCFPPSLSVALLNPQRAVGCRRHTHATPLQRPQSAEHRTHSVGPSVGRVKVPRGTSERASAVTLGANWDRRAGWVCLVWWWKTGGSSRGGRESGRRCQAVFCWLELLLLLLLRVSPFSALGWWRRADAMQCQAASQLTVYRPSGSACRVESFEASQALSRVSRQWLLSPKSGIKIGSNFPSLSGLSLPFYFRTQVPNFPAPLGFFSCLGGVLLRMLTAQ